MFQATRAIIDAFKEKNIRFTVEDNEKYSYVKAGFQSEAGTPVDVLFVSRDEDNDVSIRAESLVKLPAARLPELYKVINSLNYELRYIKFVVDKDGDLRAEFDLPIRTDNVGPVCVEMFVRFMQIINKALPTVMKAIWS